MRWGLNNGSVKADGKEKNNRRRTAPPQGCLNISSVRIGPTGLRLLPLWTCEREMLLPLLQGRAEVGWGGMVDVGRILLKMAQANPITLQPGRLL